MVTSSLDQTIKFWDVNTCNIAKVVNTYSAVYDCHVSRSETYVVSGHKDTSIRVWNAKTRGCVFKLEEAHGDPVVCVRMTPNENYIISTSKDDTIKIWDVRQRTLLDTFEHELFQLGSISTKFCVSPNSQYVVCGSKNGNMIFYDLKNKECTNIVQDQHKSQVVAVEWQPKADKEVRIASVDDLGGILIWQV